MPNMRLKRLIGTHIKTYNLDEYKTEEQCHNLYQHDKKGIRKVHSVLTYQIENKQIECINRDKNAVYNMEKIVNYYLLYKKRPERYYRTIKGINPSEQDTHKVQDQVLPCLP